jgi:hypothetical protein
MLATLRDEWSFQCYHAYSKIRSKRKIMGLLLRNPSMEYLISLYFDFKVNDGYLRVMMEAVQIMLDLIITELNDLDNLKYGEIQSTQTLIDQHEKLCSAISESLEHRSIAERSLLQLENDRIGRDGRRLRRPRHLMRRTNFWNRSQMQQWRFVV